MIPLVATEKELATLRAHVDAVAKEVFAETGHSVDYMVGTMIELPRAALQAGSIANAADFFSFGTNDLTQTAIGISRDDAARFLEQYVKDDIFAQDPFVSIDQEALANWLSWAQSVVGKPKQTSSSAYAVSTAATRQA